MMDAYLWTQPQDEGHSKEVPSGGRNEEEIAKFTVDERLGDVERAVLYLNSGQVIQQKHAIANLPGLLRGRGRPAYDIVSQPLRSALNRLDQEAQIAVAEAFATIARERLLMPADLHVCLLPLIVRNINKEKSEEETEAWLLALHDMLPQLETEVLRIEVVALALSKGEVQDSVNSRVICARILGDVSSILSPSDVERCFFKKAVAMCQDVDHQVRVSMARQMAAIGRAVGRDTAGKVILDELFELLNDEEQEVRMAAFTSLVSLLEGLSPEVRKARVLPVLRQHLRPGELDLVLQRCVARLFGAMMKAVQTDIEAEDQQLFLNCYRHFAARSDVDLRRLTAQQLHLVLAATAVASASASGSANGSSTSGGGATFSAQFSDTLNNMLGDADEAVRVAVASTFHEVASVVDKQCCAVLTRPFIRLARDGSVAVQAALLTNMASILQYWSSAEAGGAQDASLAELLRSLLDAEASLQRAWRLQVCLLQAVPAMARVFSVDQLMDLVAPMTIRALNSPVAAVRPAAADGAAAVLRAVRRDKAGRCDLFLRVVREFARGRSFSQRLTFIAFLKALLKRYSSRWFKEFALDLSLELLHDPVLNVRITMVALLPALKQTIKMPEDVDLLERLNNAMSNAMNDNDRDISSLARSCNEAYKKVALRMGGGVNLASGGGDGAGATFEVDDKRKEEEEAEAPYTAEELKEIKAEISQVGGKRNGLARPKAGAVGATARGGGAAGGAAAKAGNAAAAAAAGAAAKAGLLSSAAAAASSAKAGGAVAAVKAAAATKSQSTPSSPARTALERPAVAKPASASSSSASAVPGRAGGTSSPAAQPSTPGASANGASPAGRAAASAVRGGAPALGRLSAPAAAGAWSSGVAPARTSSGALSTAAGTLKPAAGGLGAAKGVLVGSAASGSALKSAAGASGVPVGSTASSSTGVKSGLGAAASKPALGVGAAKAVPVASGSLTAKRGK